VFFYFIIIIIFIYYLRLVMRLCSCGCGASVVSGLKGSSADFGSVRLFRTCTAAIP